MFAGVVIVGGQLVPQNTVRAQCEPEPTEVELLRLR
jgi:hypothetical protein